MPNTEVERIVVGPRYIPPTLTFPDRDLVDKLLDKLVYRLRVIFAAFLV